MSPDLFPPNKFAILTLFKIEFDFVIVAAAAAVAMIKAVVAVVAVAETSSPFSNHKIKD